MSSYNFPCPPDYEMKVTEDALALAVSGNTAPSGGLTAGKYIFLTGHSTLPDGGYHVKDTDIGAGETLSASNIEADGEGFANALNAKVSELNSKLTKQTTEVSIPSGITVYANSLKKQADVVCGTYTVRSSGLSAGATIGTLPAGYRPSLATEVPAIIYTAGQANLYPAYITIATDGTMKLYFQSGQAGLIASTSFSFIV